MSSLRLCSSCLTKCRPNALRCCDGKAHGFRGWLGFRRWLGSVQSRASFRAAGVESRGNQATKGGSGTFMPITRLLAVRWLWLQCVCPPPQWRVCNALPLPPPLFPWAFVPQIWAEQYHSRVALYEGDAQERLWRQQESQWNVIERQVRHLHSSYWCISTFLLRSWARGALLAAAAIVVCPSSGPMSICTAPPLFPKAKRRRRDRMLHM